MSDFGDAIIERVGNTELSKSSNPMNQIINNTIGEWLSNFDESSFFEQFFINEATGAYLDLHGRDYNILRRIDESDDDYRDRIINESLGHITVSFLQSVYGVELYSYVEDFSVNNNVLTSDNPYLSSNGFMGYVDNDTQAILDKKFVLGTGVTWL